MYGIGVPETLVEVSGSDVGNGWVEFAVGGSDVGNGWMKFAVNGSDAGKRLGEICSKWLGRGETPG